MAISHLTDQRSWPRHPAPGDRGGSPQGDPRGPRDRSFAVGRAVPLYFQISIPEERGAGEPVAGPDHTCQLDKQDTIYITSLDPLS